MHTWDFLKEHDDALTEQLKSDEKEWGDSWIHAPYEGMDERIAHHIEDYFLKFREVGTPIPWLKVAGYALIKWIRDNHREIGDK